MHGDSSIMAFLLDFILLVTIAMCIRIYLSGRILLNPFGIYIVSASVSGIGIFHLLDYAETSSLVHAISIILSLIFVLMGCVWGNKIKPVPVAVASRWWRKNVIWYLPRIKILFCNLLLLISALVALYYYYRVGYNLFFELLKGSTSTLISDNQDVAGLRLRAYTGDEYFAPGYVNQFKNVLLPLLCILFIVRSYKQKSLSSVALYSFVSILAIFALLGAGQRGPFVTIVLISFIFGLSMGRWSVSASNFGRLFSAKSLFGAGLGLLGIGLLSYGLGRFDEGEGALGSVVALIESLFDRFFKGNQRAGVIAFDYFYTQPVQFGRQWFEGILGLLPTHRGSDLNSYLFSLQWNSYRGNSPPSMIGSVYYNFGFIGVCFFSLLLGLSFHYVYYSLFKFQKTVGRLLIFSAIAILLGRWTIGAPVGLLNKGLPAVGLLWLLIGKATSKTSRNEGMVREKELKHEEPAR